MLGVIQSNLIELCGCCCVEEEHRIVWSKIGEGTFLVKPMFMVLMESKKGFLFFLGESFGSKVFFIGIIL